SSPSHSANRTIRNSEARLVSNQTSGHAGEAILHSARRPMRSYTLFDSVVAHVAFVCLVFVTSAIATGDLPDPRHTTEFVMVKPVPPPPPPAPVARATPQTPATANAVPLVAPEGIQPERPEPPRVEEAVPFGDTIAGTTVVADEPPPPPPPPPPPAATGPIRVGGSIQPPQKTVHVAPVYPPLALASRVSGVVILEAVIAEDGSVQNVRVLRSPPLLEQAAVDAVRQWKFTPTLLNRQPVPIVMT